MGCSPVQRRDRLSVLKTRKRAGSIVSFTTATCRSIARPKCQGLTSIRSAYGSETGAKVRILPARWPDWTKTTLFPSCCAIALRVMRRRGGRRDWICEQEHPCSLEVDQVRHWFLEIRKRA